MDMAFCLFLFFTIIYLASCFLLINWINENPDAVDFIRMELSEYEDDKVCLVIRIFPYIPLLNTYLVLDYILFRNKL